MKVRAIKLYDTSVNDWRGRIEDKYEYGDFKADDNLRVKWISFDSVLCDDNLVYVGITSFDSDIFKAYDRSKDKFIDLGYSRIVDSFDAKFHRSLIKSSDGNIYGAVALLHDVDNYWEAPGGAIVRYNPSNGDIEKIGIPISHTYIQAMVIDEKKRTAYCQTFTPEYLASFNLDTYESKILGLTGSGFGMGQGENIVLDSKGRVWGGWSVTRAWQANPGVDQYRIYCYDSEKDKIEFFRHGLPHLDGSPGYAHLDGMIAAPNGKIYCGSGEGGLFSIDPDTAEVTLIGAPVPPARIAAFAIGQDGFLYGIGGRYGNASLFRMDLENEEYELIGRLYDPHANASPWSIHDMDISSDGVIFAGENDNPHRSAYLWEIKL